MALSRFRGVVAVPAVPQFASAPQLAPGFISPPIETVGSLLVRTPIYRDGKEGALTQQEIHRLTSLTYPEGAPVLRLDQRHLIFEIVSLYVESLNKKAGDGEIFMSQLEETFKIARDAVFDSPSFRAEKNKYLADVDRARNPIKILQGIPCPKCHSTNTTTTRVQMRSADEPMTIITQCHACGTRSKG